MGGIWANLLFVTLKSNCCLLPSEQVGNSTRFPIDATGYMRCASSPRGEPRCTAVSLNSCPSQSGVQRKHLVH